MTTNPWPTSPNPPNTQQFKPHIQPPQMVEVMTLEKALMKWEAVKAQLAELKDEEMACRKVAFDLGFGAEAKEGTNTLALENGYQLKGVKKLNYKLVTPAGFAGNTVDAVDECAERFAQISNEGAFVADRLFKYTVDMSISEYRKLCDEAEYEKPKKAMLTELNKILEIKEAAPVLEIKEPKVKK